MRALVAWREGLSLTEGKIGVLSVSSLFLTQVGVYVGVCVWHTHTAQMGYLDVSPGVRMRHLEGPEESRWTKFRHTYIRICVHSTHVYIYDRRRD